MLDPIPFTAILAFISLMAFLAMYTQRVGEEMRTPHPWYDYHPLFVGVALSAFIGSFGLLVIGALADTHMGPPALVMASVCMSLIAGIEVAKTDAKKFKTVEV